MQRQKNKDRRRSAPFASIIEALPANVQTVAAAADRILRKWSRMPLDPPCRRLAEIAVWGQVNELYARDTLAWLADLGSVRYTDAGWRMTPEGHAHGIGLQTLTAVRAQRAISASTPQWEVMDALAASQSISFNMGWVLATTGQRWSNNPVQGLAKKYWIEVIGPDGHGLGTKIPSFGSTLRLGRLGRKIMAALAAGRPRQVGPISNNRLVEI